MSGMLPSVSARPSAPPSRGWSTPSWCTAGTTVNHVKHWNWNMPHGASIESFPFFLVLSLPLARARAIARYRTCLCAYWKLCDKLTSSRLPLLVTCETTDFMHTLKLFSAFKADLSVGVMLQKSYFKPYSWTIFFTTKLAQEPENYIHFS